MLEAFLLAFVAIFVALDPIGGLPMYVSLTQGCSEHQRKRIVHQSMLLAFIVAIGFMFLGEAIFRQLGITLPDFKIAGGIVLLLIALADLVGSNMEVKSRATGHTGIVPLAVPLITGPAVLTTLIFQSAHSGYPITIAALVANYLLAWQLLYHSPGVTRIIGKDGTVVISKIAALLLAAISVSMMRSGIFESIQSFHFK